MVMSTLNPDESTDLQAESQHLDRALDNVDPLLMASLRKDERKRVGRRRWIVASLFLAMLIAAGGVFFFVLTQNSPQAQATSLTTDAWKLWQARKFEEAETKFGEAVTLNPDLENAWNGLGWSRLNQGKTDEAIVAFRRCVELADAHPAANNGLGQAYLFKRDYEQAEKYLLKAAPQAPAAWFGLFRLYLLQDKFEEAKQWGEKVASVKPDDPTTERLLAAAKAGELSDELRRQIEPPKPNEAGDSAQQGWQLFRKGSMTAAKEAFEKALAADEDNLSAVNGLAFCLLNLGRPKEAKPLFEKILQKSPDAGGPLNGLARCLKAAGEVDEAIATWKKLEDMRTDVTAATVGLAHTYYERGQFKEAIQYLEKLVAADNGNASYQEMLANAKKSLDENQ